MRCRTSDPSSHLLLPKVPIMQNLFYRAPPRRALTMKDFAPKEMEFIPGRYMYGDMVVNPQVIDQRLGGPVILFPSLPYQRAVFNNAYGEWHVAMSRAMALTRQRNWFLVFILYTQLIMSAIILNLIASFRFVQQFRQGLALALVGGLLSVAGFTYGDAQSGRIDQLTQQVLAMQSQVLEQQHAADLRNLQIAQLKANAQADHDILAKARADLVQAQIDANQIRIDQLNFMAQYNAASTGRGVKSAAQAKVVAAEINRQLAQMQPKPVSD